MKYVARAIKSLYTEILKPSAREDGYTWAVIAAGHVLLGAVLSVVSLLFIPFRLIVPIWYWIVKESGDIRRGGNVTDGIKDSILVAIGALYSGPVWWPLVVAVAITIGTILIQIKREISNDKR